MKCEDLNTSLVFTCPLSTRNMCGSYDSGLTLSRRAGRSHRQSARHFKDVSSGPNKFFFPPPRVALSVLSSVPSCSCTLLTQSANSVATPHHALPSRRFDVHSSTTTPVLLHQTRGRFIPYVRYTNRCIRRDGMSHCSTCRNTGSLVSLLSALPAARFDVFHVPRAYIMPPSDLCHFSSRYMVICKRVGRS